MIHYVSMHTHNENSPDGAGRPEDAVPYAKALGNYGLGISNHGTMAGVIEHLQAGEKYGMLTPLGIEAYYQPVYVEPLPKKVLDKLPEDEKAAAEYAAKRYHLGLYMKTRKGWENMMEMLTEANEHSFYRYPIFTDALLEKFYQDIILFTGCISGYIAQHIIHDDLDKAFAKFDFFQNLFQDNFYCEVMPNPVPGQKKVNMQLIQWANKYQFPVVITEDAHMTKQSDYESYFLLQQMKGIDLDTYGTDYSVLHQHSVSQIREMYKELMGDYPPDSYFETTYEIAQQCDVQLDNTIEMPDIPGVVDVQDTLLKAAKRGIVEKHLYTKNVKGDMVILPEYAEQLTTEITIILNKNFGAYMLMYYYMCQYAKKHKIQVQARGSACGSLLTYLLGIHTIDPLRYGTFFERFCGEDRVDFPDIDLDIPDKYKQFLVEYFVTSYPGRAAQVATFGTYGELSIVKKMKDLMPFENGDKQRFGDAIHKYLKDLEEPQLVLKDMLQEPELNYLERKYHCITHFCWLFKQRTYVGTHAAGIAITKGPLTKKIAIMRHGSGNNIQRVTSASMNELNRAGVMKADLLGLSALTMLMDAEADAGVTFLCYKRPADVDPKKFYDIFDIEEPAVMKAICEGHTAGLFQSEKKKPRDMYIRLQPTNVKEMAIVNAGNRPASLKEKAFERYMDALAGKTFSKIGRPIIFQEDIMLICKDIAGLSPTHIATILKALKKYQINHPELEELFVAGCKAKGHSEKDARSLWMSMRHYTFPFAHAVVYSQVAARQAWLREHHPFSFWYATIKNEGDKHKREIYLQHAREADIWFLLPHLNGGAHYGKVVKSYGTFIQQGLTSIEGIGVSTAEAIEAERRLNGDYTSREDAEKRLGTSIFDKTLREACDDHAIANFNFKSFMEKSLQYNDVISMRTMLAL